MLGQIAKSLWSSWLVVVVSYWLDLTIAFPALLGAGAIVLIYQWLRGRPFVAVTNTRAPTPMLSADCTDSDDFPETDELAALHHPNSVALLRLFRPWF
jgi:hypothetical protein